MIALDLEASGTEPHIHSIVSIGAIDLNDPTRQFYAECKIWNGAHVMDEALVVNGFTMAEITDPKKQTDGEVTKAFLDWALQSKDHTTAGQNPSFDWYFLRYTALRNHLDWPLAHRTIDTHSLCYLHMLKAGVTPPFKNGRTDLNSAKIQQYIGIPEEPKPHNALNGAKVAAEALSRLLYDKKLLPEFENNPIPWRS
jgi:DNA polymerase III epsilon subunit-like protein